MGRGPAQGKVLQNAVNILMTELAASESQEYLSIVELALAVGETHVYPLKRLKAQYNILRDGALRLELDTLVSDARSQLNLNSDIRRTLEKNNNRFRLVDTDSGKS